MMNVESRISNRRSPSCLPPGRCGAFHHSVFDLLRFCSSKRMMNVESRISNRRSSHQPSGEVRGMSAFVMRPSAVRQFKANDECRMTNCEPQKCRPSLSPGGVGSLQHSTFDILQFDIHHFLPDRTHNSGMFFVLLYTQVWFYRTLPPVFYQI